LAPASATVRVVQVIGNGCVHAGQAIPFPERRSGSKQATASILDAPFWEESPISMQGQQIFICLKFEYGRSRFQIGPLGRYPSRLGTDQENRSRPRTWLWGLKSFTAYHRLAAERPILAHLLQARRSQTGPGSRIEPVKPRPACPVHISVCSTGRCLFSSVRSNRFSSGTVEPVCEPRGFAEPTDGEFKCRPSQNYLQLLWSRSSQ
jgi:hypothetical protein